MWDHPDGGDRLSTANEITCSELVEIVTDFLEGTMPQAERRRFEAHLDECPHCVIYLRQMRLTIRALGELGEHGGRRGSNLTSDRCAWMQVNRDLGGKVGNGGFNGQGGCFRFGSD